MTLVYHELYEERCTLLNIMIIKIKTNNKIIIKPENEEKMNTYNNDVKIFNIHCNEFFQKYIIAYPNMTINSDASLFTIKENPDVKNFAINNLIMNSDNTHILGKITTSDINKNKEIFKDDLTAQSRY